MKSLAKFPLAMAVLLVMTLSTGGCKSVNPTTGVSEYDPVKTQMVEDSLQPIISGGIRRVIRNSPQHAQDIGNYFRAIGGALCAMSASGEASPDVLIAAAEAATAKLQAGTDPYVIDIKNSVVALYKVLFSARFRAELPADQWPRHVCSLFCASINGALKDAGQAPATP